MKGEFMCFTIIFLCVLDKDGMKMAPFLKLFEPREYVDLLMMVSIHVLYVASPVATSGLWYFSNWENVAIEGG